MRGVPAIHPPGTAAFWGPSEKDPEEVARIAREREERYAKQAVEELVDAKGDEWQKFEYRTIGVLGNLEKHGVYYYLNKRNFDVQWEHPNPEEQGENPEGTWANPYKSPEQLANEAKIEEEKRNKKTIWRRIQFWKKDDAAAPPAAVGDGDNKKADEAADSNKEKTGDGEQKESTSSQPEAAGSTETQQPPAAAAASNKPPAQQQQ